MQDSSRLQFYGSLLLDRFWCAKGLDGTEFGSHANQLAQSQVYICSLQPICMGTCIVFIILYALTCSLHLDFINNQGEIIFGLDKVYRRFALYKPCKLFCLVRFRFAFGLQARHVKFTVGLHITNHANLLIWFCKGLHLVYWLSLRGASSDGQTASTWPTD